MRSDLDAATQHLLNRGSEINRIIKAGTIFSPLTVEQQTCILFAGVKKGYLDKLDIELELELLKCTLISSLAQEGKRYS